MLPEFDDLKITTITMIVNFSDRISLKKIFLLLPYVKYRWVKIEFKDDDTSNNENFEEINTTNNININLHNVKTSQEFKILKFNDKTLDLNSDNVENLNISFFDNKKKNDYPVGPPGTILGLGYRQQTRGIPLKTSAKFRNSISMIMSSTYKNIRIKLAKSCIHMCGLKTYMDGIYNAQLILDHIHEVQNIVKIIQQKPYLYQECRDFLKSSLKGEEVIIKVDDNTSRIDYKIDLDNFHNHHFQCRGPESIRVIDFFLKHVRDYEHLGSYLTFLDRIKNLKIKTNDIQITTSYTAMINLNYHLGFHVDRDKFFKFFKGKDGFVSIYDNNIHNYVKLELKYESDNVNFIKKKQKKIPHHTFIIYHTGAITQSGPTILKMKHAFELFIKNIKEYKILILNNA